MKEVRAHVGRQHSLQHSLDFLAVVEAQPAFGPSQLPETRQERSVHVFAQHELIFEVKPWRLDPAIEEFEGLSEIRPIMARRTGIDQVDGETMAAARPPDPLPIVRWQRGY